MIRNILPRALAVLVLAAAVLGLSSCQQETSNETISGHVYGNGFKDLTPVICRVGDHEITQQNLDIRYAELPQGLKGQFTGKNWERRFLHYMADEILMYDAAKALNLEADAAVRQQLISMHRETLIEAYKQLEVYVDLQPSEEEIQNYYDQYKKQFVAEGAVHIRHIQCLDEQSASQAYEALQVTDPGAKFLSVLAKYSRNIQTAAEGGDLGWINEGGYVRFVKEGNLLSKEVFGWDLGLHEPIHVGENWHIVEVLERRNPRQLSVSEVRGRIISDIMPSLQKAVLEERLAEVRKATAVEYLGEFSPGNGRSAEELFQHGLLANDPDKQLDLFDLIIEDFPDSEFAAKSLFMKANVYLDNWGDTRRARSSLRELVANHPNSELREQADYMLANLSTINFKAPKSIEELQKLAK